MMNDSIGIDISKTTLDVHRVSDGAFAQFPNTQTGFKNLRQWLGAVLPARVVFEGQTMGLTVLIMRRWNGHSAANFPWSK